MTVYMVNEEPSNKFTVECEFCKRRLTVGLPMRAKELFKLTKLFEKAHKDCER